VTGPDGRRQVLVTRAAEDCPPLEELLRARGFAPVRMPCIAMEDLPWALPEPPDFVVVASPHAARRLRARLPAGLPGARFAAVGEATAAALGLPSVLVPATGSGAEALLRTLAPLVRGKTVLLPRAEEGNPALAAGLAAAGARVISVALYRTVAAPSADPAVLALLRAGPISAVAFASGSAARGFVALAGAGAAAALSVACMGRLCADEARKAGLRVDAVADGGLPSLCDAIEAALALRQALR
jgi:uroporphyrinogen-III synthase